MLWTIRDTLDILNGTESKISADEEDTFEKKFGRKITFRQLYHFLKDHKQYINNDATPLWSCMCELCENIVLLSKGLNKYLKEALRLDVYDIMDNFMCNPKTPECMKSTCEDCSDLGLTEFDFQSDCERIAFKMWTTVHVNEKKCVKKITMDSTLVDAIEKFNLDIKTVKSHLYTNKEQHRVLRNLKENLSENEIIVYVDYSEGYKNVQQGEIQSAYFGHEVFSIFTACTYHKNQDEVVKNSVALISESNDHSRSAAQSCVEQVVRHTKEKFNLPPSCKIHIVSDGCAAQFRSRFVFALMATLCVEDDLIWYYNERHHGKGPMDGVGGTLKCIMFRKVKSGEITINTSKEFAEEAKKNISGIDVLYLPAEDEKIEDPSIANAIKIPRTLQIHKVKRTFDENKICTLQFSKIASDTEPFHVQIYNNQEVNTMCGHLIAKQQNDDNCAECQQLYTADHRDWLRCPECAQWYHENCFYV